MARPSKTTNFGPQTGLWRRRIGPDVIAPVGKRKYIICKKENHFYYLYTKPFQCTKFKGKLFFGRKIDQTAVGGTAS